MFGVKKRGGICRLRDIILNTCECFAAEQRRAAFDVYWLPLFGGGLFRLYSDFDGDKNNSKK